MSPFVLQREQGESESSASAGITIGATLGAIGLLSLVLFLVFVKRRRDKRAPERTWSKDVFFGRSSDQTLQTEQWSFNSDALPPEPLAESQRPLLPSSPPPNFRPSIPRLIIPPAPPGSITASTVDHPDMSAVYS
ncbi:hypothetical protein B0H11DRAFT_2235148 [Mycena galericulata]|nr:hypothetical protein B0H11DRAFT_2235148 [Mycena galericulata]